MRKILFIINPVSGSGKGTQLIKEINEFMEKTEIEYSIKISNRVGQIKELAKNGCLEGVSDIIIVGGDGSVHEAINGMQLRKGIRFGIIPSGTGNDYARLIYKEMNLSYYLACIKRGRTVQVDIGSVNGLRFINSCGVGIDSNILKDAEKYKNIAKGSAAYLLSTVKNLLFFKAQKIIMTIDQQKITREIILVAISKGRYFGGGMMITPNAELNDGQFEICVVNKISAVKLLMLFPSIFKGEHIHIKNTVEIFKGKMIKIETVDKQLYFEVDGNVSGVTPIKISIENAKMDIITDCV